MAGRPTWGMGFVSIPVVALLLLSACAPTTIVDTSSSTTAAVNAEGVTATTTVSGDPLDEMVRLTLGLGNEMVDGDASGRFAEIVELWAGAKPGVDDIDPALGREIDHQMEILAGAVQFKHPADADKAGRNLAIVVAAIHAQA